jgi:hypothetical protein
VPDAQPQPDPDAVPARAALTEPAADPVTRSHTHTQPHTETGTETTAGAGGPAAPAGAESAAESAAEPPCPLDTRPDADADADARARGRALAGAPAGPGQASAGPAPAAHDDDPADRRAGAAGRGRAASRVRDVPKEPLAVEGELSMTQWVALLIAMVAVCAVVLGVVVLRQRRIGDDDDPSETPDVIEYMVMMIGVVYAIVLGLAIAGVWEGQGGARADVQAEAQALHEVKERVQVYPADVRDRVRSDVDAYVTYVTGEEWTYMRDHGDVSHEGTVLLDRVRTDVTRFDPRSDLAAQAYQPVVDAVAAADQARVARGQSAGATMPGIVWFGLISGGLVTVGLVFVLQIRRSARELLLAGLFSALIAFLLFLIWDLDAPFGSGLTVSADPLRALL